MSNEEKILEMLLELTATQKTHTELLAKVEARSQQTAVLMDTEVKRKLDLLYEGHDAIMEHLEKLASRSRVEELESDMMLLKDAVKLMRQELEALKKAQ